MSNINFIFKNIYFFLNIAPKTVTANKLITKTKNTSKKIEVEFIVLVSNL